MLTVGAEARVLAVLVALAHVQADALVEARRRQARVPLLAVRAQEARAALALEALLASRNKNKSLHEHIFHISKSIFFLNCTFEAWFYTYMKKI